MKLGEIAHTRTGDKGNLCNICEVERYEVDSICSMNFVLHDSLGGGVTRSLSIDRHGKSLGMALLEMEL